MKRMETKVMSSASKRGASSGGKSGSRRKNRKPGIWKSIRQLVMLTFFGRMLAGVAIAGVAVAVDLLAVSFRYDAFFVLAGIELVLVGVFAWIRFLIRTRTVNRS